MVSDPGATPLRFRLLGSSMHRVKHAHAGATKVDAANPCLRKKQKNKSETALRSKWALKI